MPDILLDTFSKGAEMPKKKKKAQKTPAKKTARKKQKKIQRAKPALKKRRNAKAPVSKSLLSEALTDLEKEISALRAEKSATEQSLSNIAETTDETHNQEMALKERINDLARKEEELAVKKQKLNEKMKKIAEKIEKISQISSEMEEL